MYSVSAMAGPAGTLYVAGGTQDAASFQGSLAAGTAPTWVSVNGGDGYGTSYDPSAGMIYATSDTLPRHPGRQGLGQYHRKCLVRGLGSDRYECRHRVPQPRGRQPGGLRRPGPAPGRRPVPVRALRGAAHQPDLGHGHGDRRSTPAPNDDHTYSALSFGGTYLGQPDPYILYAARGDGTLWFDAHLRRAGHPAHELGRSRRDPQPGPGPERLAPRLRPDR